VHLIFGEWGRELKRAAYTIISRREMFKPQTSRRGLTCDLTCSSVLLQQCRLSTAVTVPCYTVIRLGGHQVGLSPAFYSYYHY